ncbi:tRNA lysidine(34) synthetase TilS [Streptococcus macacae]|uniref:tRNA(Ile)-lysidine synthase n=1 Tax=Streptococcus macacae NCTC 11558 TaxID=764298 RepID=G5JXL0_9STRE|nr:tRNA lysidine(34) synthetase TilS [Streptococcus macacae]EHJ52517.1 tRNA(Ile)-lysidine synthetase [Streptococcus macacae NCTC 11558]SUN77569.1 tRNA(Ile)-lysidine synthetase [Streptococcus macacae NCTC 11558]
MTYKKIFSYIQSKGYFADHKYVLIAVSGGVDSMNLLHFLHRYQQQLGIKIAIAHINHKQRIEADKEEAYLNNWAKQHNVPFYTKSFTGKFSENTARQFRYNYFKNIMFEKGYTALVTAHHADDQAETVFSRFIRGVRLRYLSGIKEIQHFGPGQLIRPFLTFSKKEFPDIFHFYDVTNAKDTYLRNRIRNNYLPILEKENSKISQHLIQLGEETHLIFQAFEDLTYHLDFQNCSVFHEQSEAVQYFLLQNYIKKFPELELTKAQFDEILHIIKTRTDYYQYVKNGYYLKKDAVRFEFCKIGPKTDRFKSEKVLEYDSMVKYGQYTFSFQKMLDSEGGIPIKSDSPIIIRKRKPGDKIQLGNYSKKIRRLFIDDKIPASKRLDAIILEQDKEILLILLDNVTYLRKDFKDDIMKGKLYIQK